MNTRCYEQLRCHSDTGILFLTPPNVYPIWSCQYAEHSPLLHLLVYILTIRHSAWVRMAKAHRTVRPTPYISKVFPNTNCPSVYFLKLLYGGLHSFTCRRFIPPGKSRADPLSLSRLISSQASRRHTWDKAKKCWENIHCKLVWVTCLHNSFRMLIASGHMSVH